MLNMWAGRSFLPAVLGDIAGFVGNQAIWEKIVPLGIERTDLGKVVSGRRKVNIDGWGIRIM